MTTQLKLMITPGGANPSPPVGPALGQKGVNIMEFCKAFNAQTQALDKSMKVKVIITVNDDRTFSFQLKTPATSALILKEVGAEKGCAKPGHQITHRLTLEQVEKIAKIKLPDLTATDLKAAMKTVAGTARNMGIGVEGEL